MISKSYHTHVTLSRSETVCIADECPLVNVAHFPGIRYADLWTLTVLVSGDKTVLGDTNTALPPSLKTAQPRIHQFSHFL